MEKARVIVADTDVNYIALFQEKLVSKFYDKIDLEIITDGEYYKTLFCTPQNVDIFIISEDLYDSSIKRHNIRNLFVMTEKQEVDFGSDIHKIYKYSSIKEILNVILSNCSDILNVENDANTESKIVLITSANGGVGKTTVAMGLAACLSRNNIKTLYLDSNKLHTFQYKLKNKTPITETGLYLKMMMAKNNIYNDIKQEIRNETFDYLPPFKAPMLSLGIDFNLVSVIAQEAKTTREYDYIIVDSDSTFDEVKANLLEIADKIIIVTKQNNASVAATNELIANINGINKEKYKFICNDSISSEQIPIELLPNYSVNDCIEHIEKYDQLEIKEFGSVKSMQRAAYLLD